MKKGWLINDCLTCIPGTKTFWHDLLEWILNLQDKTFGYTNYSILPSKIESLNESSDYIIRNATFFRPLNLKTKTISLIQDIYNDHLRQQQIEVCNNSEKIIFNSPYTFNSYKNEIDISKSEIIPLGTDFDFFNEYSFELKEQKRKEYGLNTNLNHNYILYVGSSLDYPKGFNKLLEIVSNTKHEFIFVMKDDWKTDNKRIKVFNKIDHNKLRDLINCSNMLICTSKQETLHLAGIEAAACNIPLLVTNVGAYYGLENDTWGKKLDDNYKNSIECLLNDKIYSPRQFFLDRNYDKKSCKNSWLDLVNKI